MNRRQALFLLTSSAACAMPASVIKAAESGQLTDADVTALLRGLTNIEPTPGEAERIRNRLTQPSVSTESDPRIQPALAFDPEVELS